MKTAAILTSRVMEAIGRLPGIATLDWCDRAAAAMSRMHHPSLATVLLATLDARGTIDRVEAAGGAVGVECHAAETNVRGMAKPPETGEANPIAGAIRGAWSEGAWLGWTITGAHEGGAFVGTASQLGLLGGRGDSPFLRRWHAYNPADVIVGAVAMSHPGRFIIVEIGSSDASFRDNEREQAVMAACLPALRKRLLTAIGDDPPERQKWLTPREELILWYLVAGKKVPQIAQELHRSIYTVHDHVKSLHRKLGASNRGQLVARALGHLGALNEPVDAGADNGVN
jgi:DNA-binding CsgD family transcriptional regulator